MHKLRSECPTLGNALATKHKKPVRGVFKHAVGLDQRAQPAEIADHPSKIVPLLVDLPEVLSIEHIRRMEAVLPHRSSIRQANDHMPPADPNYLMPAAPLFSAATRNASPQSRPGS